MNEFYPQPPQLADSAEPAQLPERTPITGDFLLKSWNDKHQRNIAEELGALLGKDRSTRSEPVDGAQILRQDQE